MTATYWHKQTPEKPLFPDLQWSRPENRNQAGKVLIVGGNAHGFAAAGDAYSEAVKAGIGTARVLLPDSLQKTVGRVFEAGEYAPSTPSGSFSKQSIAELCDMGAWADGVILAGDLGRNSETAIALEQFVGKFHGQLTITKDAVDYFISNPPTVITRSDTLLVLSFAQLQKLAIGAKFAAAFTFEMDFLRLIDLLHEFTTQYEVHIIVRHLDTIFVAASGEVSTTKVPETTKIWRVKTAAHAAVWWLQNPSKPFEALTTGVFELLPAK